MADSDASTKEIERDLARHRVDLAESVEALAHAVREKVDVPARARVTVARTRQRAETQVREHPVPVLLATAALGIAIGFALGRT